MKKFSFDDYKGKNVVICCRTKEEVEKFCSIMEFSTEKRWWENYLCGDLYKWIERGNGFCFGLSREEAGGVGFYTDNGYEILEMSEFWKHSEDNDTVNHPSHYTSGDIECIDAIRASMSHEAFCGYLKGNVIKYLWRYQLKVNPVEDLQKADWYLKKLEEEEK